MSLTYVKGDLFAANERAMAHGCNCHGVMGAGVAKIVRDHFPSAYAEYRYAHDHGQFYPGLAQPVRCYKEVTDEGRILTHEATTVYNLATQNAPGPNAQLSYVVAAFANMKRHMDHVGNRRIAMPKIGAGIGGLVWDRVEEIAIAVFDIKHDAYDVVVYEL